MKANIISPEFTFINNGNLVTMTLGDIANNKSGIFNSEAHSKAHHIIAESLQVEFYLSLREKYVFQKSCGSELATGDIFDALVDLPNEFTIELRDSSNNLCYSVVECDLFYALAQLNDFIWKIGVKEVEKLTLSISGIVHDVPLSVVPFHYCYAEGRISEEELIMMLQDMSIEAA